MGRCILPSVIEDLNLISNNLEVVKVTISDDDIAKVTILDKILDEWNNLNHFHFILHYFLHFKCV